MAWWVIAYRKADCNAAKRILEEMGVQVEREFTIESGIRVVIWAEMLVEAEALGVHPSIVMANNAVLDSQDKSVFLEQCGKQGIEVCSLECLNQLWSGEMRKMVKELVDKGYPAGQKTLSWWIQRNNLAEKYVGKAALLDFERWLRRARVLRRIGPTEGKRSGRTAFGDKPEERVVVERILGLHRQRKNLTQIANTINSEGHMTLTGKHFRPQTVKNYIQRYGADPDNGLPY
jgi:adenylate kinase family enzyme